MAQTKTVESAGSGQVLHHPGVYRASDAFAEIHESLIFTVLLSGFDHSAGGGFSDVFDCAEAEADGLAVHGEINIAAVNVRRQDRNAHFAAFVDKECNLFGAVYFAAQHRGHKLHRIVGFQICGLIRHIGVGGAMGFVEPVSGEFGNFLPYLVRQRFVDIVGFGAAFDELGFLLLQFLDFLLADSAAQNVGPAEREPAQHLHDLHNLLLIEHYTVGFVEVFFHLRMVVFNFFQTLLAGDEVRDELHRSRTVNRDQRNHMFDGFHPELAAQVLHAGGFQLEHRNGIAAIEQFERIRVIQRNF